MGTGVSSLEILQEQEDLAEIARFKISLNFLTVDINLHYRRLTVKNTLF